MPTQDNRQNIPVEERKKWNVTESSEEVQEEKEQVEIISPTVQDQLKNANKLTDALEEQLDKALQVPKMNKYEQVFKLEKEIAEMHENSETPVKEQIDEVPNEPKEANLKSFTSGLESLINLYSMENWCNVPDFILAEMVTDFIVTTGVSIKKTLTWHGCDSVCHDPGMPYSDAYIEGYKKWQEGKD